MFNCLQFRPYSLKLIQGKQFVCILIDDTGCVASFFVVLVNILHGINNREASGEDTFCNVLIEKRDQRSDHGEVEGRQGKAVHSFRKREMKLLNVYTLPNIIICEWFLYHFLNHIIKNTNNIS